MRTQAQDLSYIHTEDIPRFWAAYDSVLTTTDESGQLDFIQTIYVNQASEGLKAFMAARNFTTAEWLNLIKKAPAFWVSIRPKTMAIASQAKQVDALMQRFKKLYRRLSSPPYILPSAACDRVAQLRPIKF